LLKDSKLISFGSKMGRRSRSQRTPSVDTRNVCQTPREKPEKREWGIFEMSPPCVKRINKESGEIECMYLPLDVVEERMKYDGMAKYIKARDEEPTLKQKIYY
jgi:hypothetical protein